MIMALWPVRVDSELFCKLFNICNQVGNANLYTTVYHTFSCEANVEKAAARLSC